MRKGLFIPIIYFIYLFTVRITIEVILGNWLNQFIPRDLVGSLIWSFIKLIYWCIPIFIYLFYKRINIKRYILQKYSLRFNFLKLGILLLVWTFLLFFQYGIKLEFNTSFYIVFHNVIFTAFIEEFVFRGFLLDYFRKTFNINTANLFQSILFSFNHLPFLYVSGIFENFSTLIISLIFYIFFGFLCGYLTNKSKTLLPITIFHGVNSFILGWVGGW